MALHDPLSPSRLIRNPVVTASLGAAAAVLVLLIVVWTVLDSRLSHATEYCPREHKQNWDMACTVLASSERFKLIHHFEHDLQSESVSLYDGAKHSWVVIEGALAVALLRPDDKSSLTVSGDTIFFEGKPLKLSLVENEHRKRLD